MARDAILSEIPELNKIFWGIERQEIRLGTVSEIIRYATRRPTNDK